MGYLSAYGAIETTGDLSQAISLHFASNCYPPVPQYMVPVAVEAVEAVVEEDYARPIELPEETTYKGETIVRAGDVVESLYLHAFVDFLIESNTEEENN